MVMLRQAMVVATVLFFLSGCGETVRGVKEDASRIGRGVRQIFVSD